MQSAALTIKGTNLVSISYTPEAIDVRDELLSRARKGNTVTSAESAARCAEILKELRAFSRTIEAQRKQAKAPVLELGETIDSTAAVLITDVNAEAARLGQLLGTWQAEQNRIAEEAHIRAYEEEQRIRREAEEKERAEAERIRLETEAKQAELQRQAQEAEARAASLKTKAAQERARAEAEKKRQEAAAEAERAEKQATAAAIRTQEETAQAIVSSHSQVATVAAPKIDGIATRTDVKFDVVDIVALYEAMPILVKLTPENAMIKAALKKLQPGQNLPGVRHWFVAASSVR